MFQRTLNFDLRGFQIQTPLFMPCGTKGTVKGLTPEELNDIGCQIILGNTYHLYMRPGQEIMKKVGGLHKFMNWERPILTDSGGFQVFSLGSGNKEENNVKIKDDGVEFKSHLDGSKHIFTPEKVIEIQRDIGSNIMMPLDVCTSAKTPYEESKKMMALTFKWWEQAWIHYNKVCDTNKQWLFPIIQGALHEDQRKEATKFAMQFPVKGFAIGSIGNGGESKEEMYKQAQWVVETLGDDPRPRYVMGIGMPEDLLEFVERGIDMFDCVIPTRLGRHGVAFTSTGMKNMKNAEFKEDLSPMDTDEWIYEPLKKYSKAYIRHLIVENEMLASRILSLNNIHFLNKLMEKTRIAISENRFREFKKEFLGGYLK